MFYVVVCFSKYQLFLLFRLGRKKCIKRIWQLDIDHGWQPDIDHGIDHNFGSVSEIIIRKHSDTVYMFHVTQLHGPYLYLHHIKYGPYISDL